jgi:hypothetical protein
METASHKMLRNADLFRQHGGQEADYVEANVRVGMKWGSQQMANRLMERDGPVIQSGLFAGMAYHRTVAEGALAARLLGTYEAELHPHIERILATQPKHIVDIGCAEGIYAVGFARLAPFAKVFAFDIEEHAQHLARTLAEMNGVSDRVTVGGLVDHARLNAMTQENAFVFCDIEGGEQALLDPEAAPNLKRACLIVETHPTAAPNVTKTLHARFAPTHDVTLVNEVVKPPPKGHWLERAPTIDQFCATWEWRHRPTPWLVMEPR